MVLHTHQSIFACKKATTFFALLVLLGICSGKMFAQWTERGGTKSNYAVDSTSLEGPGAEWSVRMGISDSESIVDGDRVLITAAGYTDSGLEATRILCLNRLTGTTEWDVLFPENSYASQDISDRYPVRPLATPVVAGDSVVCVGYGGSVRCLDKRNGVCRWEIDLVKDFGAEPVQYGFATSPWSDGQQVLVACGGSAGTVLSVELLTGKEKWRCGEGQVSYCSFVKFQLDGGSKQIVYASKDELLAIHPSTGAIAWQYSYPKKGLTNAVTPIAVDRGKLLVAGQGLEGTRLLSVDRESDATYRVTEVWTSAKQQPFYCNWVQLQSDKNLVVGFASKTLFALDWRTGEIQSQLRNWTDCNLVATPDGALAIRGDGYVGKLEFPNRKPVQVAGYGKIRDRVWCAPSISDGSLIIRGRNAVYCVPLSRLQTEEPTRSGTAITSMDAMYGTQTEAIEELIAKAKNSTGPFTWEDYAAKASDESVQMGEGDYSQVLKALSTREQHALGLRIATDWVVRQPLSIPAFQAKLEFLRKLNRGMEADEEENARLVEVQFLVTAHGSIAIEQELFLTGNTPQLGNWNGVGVKLKADADRNWRGNAKVLRGDLQFKVTGGSFDTVEIRADGRSTSNRRFRVQSACEIRAEVAALKGVSKNLP